MYSELLAQLSHYLKRFQALWLHSPFYHGDVPWRGEFPQLYHALLALDEHEYLALDDCPDKLYEFLQQFIPDFQDWNTMPMCSQLSEENALNKFLAVDVPGRKWQQMQAFIVGMQGLPGAEIIRVVDWCAGKSHLGRAAAHQQGWALRAIERNPELCQQGQLLAERFVPQSEFQCCDVLIAPPTFEAGERVIALHACGDLHRTLLRQWLASASQQLVLAPCCYHQWFNGEFQPLSQLAQQHNLHLDRTQVRLAVQEMVTSPPRIRRQVMQLKAWRLGFDELQRELRGVDEYLPTPSLPNSAVNWGAEGVLLHLAGQKGLTIPPDMDLQCYVERGEARFAKVKRLELAAHGFRRAIELWLVLDLVNFLQEGGCEVQLQQFCAREISPRNLQILATRQ